MKCNLIVRLFSQCRIVETLLPFDPIRKHVIVKTIHLPSQKTFLIAKGAPQVILNLTNLSELFEEDLAAKYHAMVKEYASRGFRTLGVAISEDICYDSDCMIEKSGEGTTFDATTGHTSTISFSSKLHPWTIIGLLAFFDPPRPDTATTLSEAKSLGLSLKMLTGDSLDISVETCRQLNMGTNIYDVTSLTQIENNGTKGYGGSITLNDAFGPMGDFIEVADGFAQVFPQHKYLVVEVLQKRGHFVAMTGKS